MSTIVTGVLFSLIGLSNLLFGRAKPERVNAGLMRGVGWFGIACGLVMIACGLILELRSRP